MEKIIKRFLLKHEESNKKTFDLSTLESYVIDQCKGYNFYLSKGGYSKLYEEMMCLKQNNWIKEIENSSYNGLNPPLKIRWKIVSEVQQPKWDSSKMLRYSDLLDFNYYINHPSYQTDLEWSYVENIYQFLKIRELREWVSIEERSLELFYDEKFLKNRKEGVKGRYGILKRLKLSYEDLKMKKYGEMFIYWNEGIKNIKNIIILENHSTFFAYKKAAEAGLDLFGFMPDILIYGGGKKIENSFSFLEEITDVSKVSVLYFGDIDSEGFGIYYRLKLKYPHIHIQLQQKAYVHLIDICSRYYPLTEQEKNLCYFNCFLEEIETCLNSENLDKLKYIWDHDFRIPQELINYEYLLKVNKR